MKRRAFFGAAGCLALPSVLRSQTAAARAEEAPALQAWVGAEIWTGDGQIYSGGQVLVHGEKIVEVGPAGPLPTGAVVHDVRGRFITPGWVLCETPLGLVEVEQVSSTVDSTPGDSQGLRRVRASYSVVDGYNPLSSLLGVAQRGGVTSAVSSPSGGLVAGTSAWADLLAPQQLVTGFQGAVVEEHVALHADPFSSEWGSRPRGVSLLREAFESARLYSKSPRAFEAGKTRELGLSPTSLRRLSECFSGRPLVVKVSRASDIHRSLELGREYSLRLILSGVEEGWLVASEVAEAEATVVLNPLENLPVSFAALRSHRENAARMKAAGVRVIFSTFDAHQAHNLRQLAGNSVVAGVSKQDALSAICREPARAFGQGASTGILAAGKQANLSIWTGEPFELQSWAQTVVVRGQAFTPRSRQDVLFERYRDLDQVPLGRRS